MPYKQQEIDLEHFLMQVRLLGIAVGLPEIRHLQGIFLRSPALSRTELSELFCALLAKDETQRYRLRWLFEQLLPYEAPVVVTQTSDKPQPATTPDEKQEESTDSPNSTPNKVREPNNILKTGSLFILIISLGLIIYSFLSHPIEPTTFNNHPVSENKPITEITEPTPPKAIHAPKLQKTITFPQAEITVTQHSFWHYLGSPFILFLASGLGFLGLLQRAIQRTRIKQQTKLEISGKCRFYLPAIQDSQDFFLLNGHARREISWGINHILTDIPQTQLDIPRSVRETARTGLPSVHFKAATRVQEIQLWQDQSSENPDLSCLADEISVTLHNANIEVQRGYFHAMPDKISDAQGAIIWSRQHPALQHLPIILILLDTESLYISDALNLPDNQRILQAMSHWDALALIDCNKHPGELEKLLNPYSITCLLPQTISHWLAQQVADVSCRLSEYLLPQIYDWAFACSLPDRPLMIGEIRALHDALKLDCAWHINELIKRYARHSGAGLDFSQQRAENLKEFSERASSDPEFVQLSVGFWLARYKQIDDTLLKQQNLWKNSPQQHALHRQTALLQLWLTEHLTTAANTLSKQHDEKKLSQSVANSLGYYALQDWPDGQGQDKQWLRLPYTLKNMDSRILSQLLIAGFGGPTTQIPALRCNSQTSLVTGTLGGISCVALIACGLALQTQSPTVHHNGLPPINMLAQLQDKTLLLGTPKFLEKSLTKIEGNSSIHVQWLRGSEQDYILRLGNSQLWRVGSLPYTFRPHTPYWPTLSIAVIAANPSDKNAQQLAIRLLDTASADQVLIGIDWHLHLPDSAEFRFNLATSQWLYIFPEQKKYPTEFPTLGQHIAVFNGNWEWLLDTLATPGIHLLSCKIPVPGSIKVIRGQPALFGVDNKDSLVLRDDIILQRIPAGEFQMGVKKSAFDNERPLHTVQFNQDFYMSQTEITFAQYDAYAVASQVNKPDDQGWGRANQPIINVSWEDAQGYTKWLSQESALLCRLPSEAEWEYAARAGSQAQYSWGDKIGTNKANCNGCGSYWDAQKSSPVASFKANDWGLYDMHGNVEEWVQDCWSDNYQQAPKEGEDWVEQCNDAEYRVLRGGSWISDPEKVRSGHRNGSFPSFNYDHHGFRVMCSLPFREQ